MTRVRSVRRQAHLDRLHEAQDGCCYLCGKQMPERFRYNINAGWSADHVHPRCHGYSRWRNVLLSHASCNRRKGDRAPFPCEVIYLQAVNARLAEEARLRHGYDDGVRAPSALALALERIAA